MSKRKTHHESTSETTSRRRRRSPKTRRKRQSKAQINLPKLHPTKDSKNPNSDSRIIKPTHKPTPRQRMPITSGPDLILHYQNKKTANTDNQLRTSKIQTPQFLSRTLSLSSLSRSPLPYRRRKEEEEAKGKEKWRRNQGGFGRRRLYIVASHGIRCAHSRCPYTRI